MTEEIFIKPEDADGLTLGDIVEKANAIPEIKVEVYKKEIESGTNECVKINMIYVKRNNMKNFFPKNVMIDWEGWEKAPAPKSMINALNNRMASVYHKNRKINRGSNVA